MKLLFSNIFPSISKVSRSYWFQTSVRGLLKFHEATGFKHLSKDY